MSDFLQREQFLRVSQDFLECYPALKIKPKLDRIFFILKEIEADDVKYIFDCMIDTYKQAPTPDDIRKEVIVFKKNYYLKNGKYYGRELNQPTEKNDCEVCDDLGYLNAKHRTSNENLLFTCNCEKGKNIQKNIPHWDNSLKPVYEIGKCPLEWFKPVIVDTTDEKIFMNTLLNKYNAWMQRVSESQNHWIDLGFLKKELK